MIRSAIAACLIASLTGPALAQTSSGRGPQTATVFLRSAASDDPFCNTLEQDLALAKTLASSQGWGLLTLDGDQAHRFMTEVHGQMTDHLMIFTSVKSTRAIVELADGPCGGINTQIYLTAPQAIEAYRHARN